MPGFEFSPRAAEDVKDIVRYTKGRWGLEQARRYRQELELGLQKLSLSPNLGRNREDIASTIRSFRVGSHIAFYKADKDRIVVIRVLHSSMDVERAFQRQAERSEERDR